MMPILYLMIMLAFTTLQCSGLSCRQCNNARTEEQCTGTQVCQATDANQPPGNQQICSSFYKTSNGGKSINKGCKQRDSCKTEEGDKATNDCSLAGANEDCRCCCDEDMCNIGERKCVEKSDCEELEVPENGGKKCTNGNKLNSVCTYNCDEGYKLVGEKKSKCSRQTKNSKSKWVPPETPECQKIIPRCKPQYSTLLNGAVSCENSDEHADKPKFNYIGSVCEFTCDSHFCLKGKKRLECQEHGKTEAEWSNKPPTCEQKMCPSIPTAKNRKHTCSDGLEVGSRCTFECADGYKLVGSEVTECEETETCEGIWSNPPPKCKKIHCNPEQKNPINGKVTCTDENFEKSICTFTCNAGFDIDGTVENRVKISCDDDNDGDELGEWSGPPATCTEISCDRQSVPDMGTMKCTNDNHLDSVCTFTCKLGYDMVGTTKPEIKSKCFDDGDGDRFGEWTEPPPSCTPITCEPPRSDPLHGRVECVDENRFNSKCAFECDDLYDLDGTTSAKSRTTCLDDGDGDILGEWVPPEQPTCTLITCLPEHKDPDNGFVFCSARNSLRSTCEFLCLAGYKLAGSPFSTCKDIKQDGDAHAEWTSKAPKCVLDTCDPQDHDKNVLQTCDSDMLLTGYPTGTICEYRCRDEGTFMRHRDEDNLILSGSLTSECRNNKTWSYPPPKCEPITCNELTTPENGYPPTCTNAYKYNSKCEFNCKKDYEPSHNRPLNCEDDGDGDRTGIWSDKEPTCEKVFCDPHPEVNNGDVFCPDGLRIGSVCNLVCHPGFTTKRDKAECVEEGRSASPGWRPDRNVCCVKCLFNPLIRLVMVIDKTALKSQEDWYKVIDFIQITMHSLHSSRFTINFGIVLFDDDVDVSTDVFPLRLVLPFHFEDIDEIVAELENTLITFSNEVSNQGNAIEFACEELFSPLDPKEEPYVALLTDKESNDDVLQKIKSCHRDINKMAVALCSDSDDCVSDSYLGDITGNADYVVHATSFNELSKFAERVNDISIDFGCSAASSLGDCT